MVKTHVISTALLLAGFFLPTAAAQQPSDSMVVVLKSYGVMTGQVTHVAEGIEIRTALGSTTVLRFDQIGCLADSLDGAYMQLADGVNWKDAQSVRRLFDWCLRNRLGDRAAELLAQGKAQGFDPNLQQQMQRRLDNFTMEARRVKNQVWPSDIDQSSDSKSVASRQIEQTVEALPAGTEAFFNQQLHSKLVIGCAAAKCHSRNSEAFALWHHGKGIANPRGLTRYNLFQTLKYVDQDEPSASKILELAHTAHGGQTQATFDENDVAYQLLLSWTYAVSRHPERYLTQVIQKGTSNPAAAMSGNESSSTEKTIAQVGFLESEPIPAAPPQSTPKQVEGEPAAPSDPCDPNLFNQQHHLDRNR